VTTNKVEIPSSPRPYSASDAADAAVPIATTSSRSVPTEQYLRATAMVRRYAANESESHSTTRRLDATSMAMRSVENKFARRYKPRPMASNHDARPTATSDPPRSDADRNRTPHKAGKTIA
jgi:hypothetical protein